VREEESMSKEMVVSANPHETRVAILEEGQLCEYYVEREKEFALVGSIYKGRVTRVLPGMQSAFVEIGLDSDAFLYVSDFLEDVEDVEDQIVTTVEDKVQKMEEQGGHVFASGETAGPAIEPADVESAAAAEAPENGTPSAETVSPAAAEGGAVSEETPAPSQRYSSPQSGPAGNRGWHDNRGPRRDFGRRGGRKRHGRGRGNDRHRGRELPQSKYASPRSYEDRSSGPSAPGDHTPVILPGESLAKYRDRAPSAAAPAQVEEPSSANHEVATHDTAVQHEAAANHEIARHETHERRPAYHSFSGLEPLPGETLAKYQPNEPSAAVKPIVPAEPFETPAPHHAEHESEHPAPAETEALPRSGSSESVSHDNPETAGLSEEQAATLAAHVTEAQIEEAVRKHEAEEEHETEELAASYESDHDSVEAEDSDVEEARANNEDLEAERAQEEAEDMTSHDAGEFGAEVASEQPAPADDERQPEHLASEPEKPPFPQEQQPWRARVRDDFRARMQHPRRGGRDRERGRRDDRGRRDRRPHHGYGHHRQQQRRPQLIADMLKQGQEIIVQIAKEPLGKKGARITSHVALPGRFLVYMPTLDHTGVSRKIASADDRARLRHLVNEAKGAASGGFIVRTAAGSATPDEIRTDVEFLTRAWTDIKARAEQRKAPALLHRDLNLVERILRDYVNSDYSAIWVDTEDEYTKVVDFMSRFQPDLVNRVKLYTKETPVFEEFGIQQEIDKGLRPKVWLKSGGYIVINHTEALVAIDVNTGKFVGKGSTRLEDTIVRTNLEAVKEIVRQMRLRDLGGIIIIDFIDMEERRNREKVMAALEDALRADRAPSKVLRFNEFGLVAITRKRTKQALERTLCQPCPYCTGSGMVKSIPTLCYEIQGEARKMAPEMDAASITLRVHPEISKALKTRESSLIEELEHWTKKSVIIQADPTLHWEQYDIY
jgi:ribonuclease G